MDIEATKTNAMKAIMPLKSVDTDFYGGTRTQSGRSLPEYYLVYFLLVDLLGFRCLGKAEKIAWSIPLDLDGQLLYVEHRKMGLGIFSSGDANSEAAAEEVVRLIRKGLRVARPYLDWCADKAVKDSNVTIINRSVDLSDRFEFLLEEYRSKLTEAESKARQPEITAGAGGSVKIRFPDYRLLREANWLALSAIESFFSWTEHVFILLAVMQGKCITGECVKDLAGADWKVKFRIALNIDDPKLKRHYDDLTVVRDQVRNFVAHGSFGKKGEAFLFHSAVGAVPVMLPHRARQHSYRFLSNGGVVAEREAISSIEHFIECIRTGPLAPAWTFLDSDLNLVLTQASRGFYEDAMESEDAMKELVEMENYFADAYADMDWWLLP